MSQPHAPLITLLTDFGLQDHYVASIKGTILDIMPQAVLVDMCHEVPARDIWAAGFLLQAAYSCFPPHTIHLCVVDPGVGTSRRPIIVTTEHHWFVAPDNGLLSPVYEREKDFHVFEITAEHYFRKPLSRTFHGRDLFAPVAAWLARGIEPVRFGNEVNDPVRLDWPRVRRSADNEFVGAVLHVDRFGNLVTNFPAQDMEKVVERGNLAFQYLVKEKPVSLFYRAYAEAPPGEVFAISGSSGYVEFSVRDGSAAAASGAVRGDIVRLLLSPKVP
jgi:S-adenosylmethionine hydrolase